MEFRFFCLARILILYLLRSKDRHNRTLTCGNDAKGLVRQLIEQQKIDLSYVNLNSNYRIQAFIEIFKSVYVWQIICWLMGALNVNVS